jgi:type VI secretion system protein ImpC
MMRDKIGQTKEERQLQIELQTWISRYVDVDPDNTSERVKAQKPLREAKVTIEPDKENPGYYQARFYLRPHYQLEGMDIGLSLVSKVPQGDK